MGFSEATDEKIVLLSSGERPLRVMSGVFGDSTKIHEAKEIFLRGVDISSYLPVYKLCTTLANGEEYTLLSRYNVGVREIFDQALECAYREDMDVYDFNEIYDDDTQEWPCTIYAWYDEEGKLQFQPSYWFPYAAKFTDNFDKGLLYGIWTDPESWEDREYNDKSYLALGLFFVRACNVDAFDPPVLEKLLLEKNPGKDICENPELFEQFKGLIERAGAFLDSVKCNWDEYKVGENDLIFMNDFDHFFYSGYSGDQIEELYEKIPHFYTVTYTGHNLGRNPLR